MEEFPQTSSSSETVHPDSKTLKRPREEEARDGPATPSTAQGTPSSQPKRSPVALGVPYKGPPSSRNSSSATSPLAGILTTKRTTFPSTPQDKTKSRNEKWTGLLFDAMNQEKEGDDDMVREVCGRIVNVLPANGEEAKDVFLMLCCNLKDPKNTELRGKIKSGAIPPEVLVTLGERDLINPERRKKLDEEFEIRAKDTNLKEIANSKRQSSQLFQCPRCKVRDCSFYQMQTRSADEPMTTFCECNKCGQHWKKY